MQDSLVVEKEAGLERTGRLLYAIEETNECGNKKIHYRSRLKQ